MKKNVSSSNGMEACVSVLSSLKHLYTANMLPLEKKFFFNTFYAPLLGDGDFDARPMVLLLGQYSTGKSTFVRYLLEDDYSGIMIGPEPTTDRFTAVEFGETEQLILGNAATADTNSPYYPLSDFGNGFLSRFVVSQSPAPVLKGLTIIDTPGILSGAKQNSRGYEFDKVVKWFAERCDLILLFFDAYKLDISDEFRRSISVLKSHEPKMRILLNKADTVSNRQLLRVFGALMWSLGKVIDSPEVVRIYVGSFWDKPLKNEEFRQLFEDEENELLSDIAMLPKTSSLRKLNDFVKRMRLLKCHASLLNHLRKQIPIFGKENKKKQLISNIAAICDELSKETGIPKGDFPTVDFLQDKLAPLDWSLIPKLDSRHIAALDNALHHHMPSYMSNLVELAKAETLQLQTGTVVQADQSPFFKIKGKNNKQTSLADSLQQPVDVSRYQHDFEALPFDNMRRLSGSVAKEELIKSKLPAAVLHRIWNLADITQDGFLDLYEYSLARHLIEFKLKGGDLPAQLPDNLKNSATPFDDNSSPHNALGYSEHWDTYSED